MSTRSSPLPNPIVYTFVGAGSLRVDRPIVYTLMRTGYGRVCLIKVYIWRFYLAAPAPNAWRTH
ncbi:MAG: hypothetical protein IPK82_04560 [Polyangiaceae bacterium]|nr:hypothetical protein [Polyangiaceae bacterium]